MHTCVRVHVYISISCTKAIWFLWCVCAYVHRVMPSKLTLACLATAGEIAFPTRCTVRIISIWRHLPERPGRISGELAASTHNSPGLGRALSAAEINDLAASRGNLSGSESVFCATACRTGTLRSRCQPMPWSTEGRTKHGCSITSPPVGHVPSLVIFFLNLWTFCLNSSLARRHKRFGGGSTCNKQINIDLKQSRKCHS